MREPAGITAFSPLAPALAAPAPEACTDALSAGREESVACPKTIPIIIKAEISQRMGYLQFRRGYHVIERLGCEFCHRRCPAGTEELRRIRQRGLPDLSR